MKECIQNAVAAASLSSKVNIAGVAITSLVSARMTQSLIHLDDLANLKEECNDILWLCK